MTIRTVYIDRPVWIREEFSIDIPDEVMERENAEIKEWLDENAILETRVHEEELDNIYGMDRQYIVDDEDLS